MQGLVGTVIWGRSFEIWDLGGRGICMAFFVHYSGTGGNKSVSGTRGLWLILVGNIVVIIQYVKSTAKLITQELL